jgi:TP901 family phage tail tape measure protein
MATTTVLYRLVGQDAGASRAFGEVGGSASAMDKAMRAAALGAIVVGAVLVKAADDAVKFQSSMTKISTQAGASAKDVKQLSAAVLKLAPSTQQGPDQLSEALYHLKSIGLDNVTAMKDLKVASDLAAVGGSNLEDTTNALGGAWRSGIKGAETFAQSAATVNAIIGAGNMKMQDFVAAIGTGILPAAKTFGVSLSSIGSALALMTDEGIPAVDAATRLKMSLSLLAAPSKIASKQLATIGLTGLQMANMMRSPAGLVGTIGLLKEHLDASGLSLSKQAILLSHAFGGGRSSSAILTMINNYSVLKKKQDQVNDSLGKYGPAVEAQRKTAEAQLKMIESSLETMSIRLGNALLPPLTKFVTWINGTLIPQIGAVKAKFMSIIPIDQIKSDLKTAQSEISDFMTTLFPKKAKPAPKQTAASPHPGVALLPGGERVILPKAPKPVHGPTPKTGAKPGAFAPAMSKKPHPGVSSLNNAQLFNPAHPMPVKAAPVKSQGTKLADQLKTSISGGIAGIDWNKIGGVLGGALVVGLSKGLDALANIGDTITKIIGKIDWFNVGAQVGGQAIGFALGFLSNLGADLFSASFWEKHWLGAIIGIISIIPIGRLAGVLGKVFEHIPILKVVAPLLKLIEHLGGYVEKGFGKLLKPLGRFFSDIGGHFLLGLEEVFPKLDGFATRLGDKLFGPFKRFPGVAKQWGTDLIHGFITGQENAAIQVGKWVGGFFDKVIGWFKGIFGIHSPATSMMPIGGALIDGLLHGAMAIAATIGGVFYKWVFQPINAALFGAPKWLFDQGKQLIEGLLNGAVAAFGFIDKWVIEPIKSAFNTLWTVAIQPVLKLIVGGFVSMADSVLTTAVKLFGWVPGVGSQLKSAKKAFDEFAAGVNDSLGGIKPKTVPVSVSFNGVPEGKITGHTYTSTTGFSYKGGGLLKGPGTGTSDSILATSPQGFLRVSNEEFIVNAASTRKHLGLLRAINADDVKTYAKGGMVGFTRAATGDMGAAAKLDTAAEVKRLASAYAHAYNKSSAIQGLAWAKTQVGMPYQWGGNGNPSWDCSGFMSAIESVMRGQQPHRRWATGAFAGNTAPPGWVQGAKAPFMIGVTNAGVGHTAGTINGTNVEMSTVGGRVGPSARGANDPMFPMHYGLVGFDKGGIARGKGYMPKMTHAPERVLSPRQTAAFEQLVANLGQAGGGKGQFTKLGAAIPAGVAAGVSGNAGAAHAAVTAMAKGTVTAFSTELQIASPSKKYRTLGAYVITGLVQGLTGSTASVKSATKRIASALYVEFGSGHHALQAKVASDNRQLLKLAGQRDTVAAKLKKANASLVSLQKQWASAQKSVSDNIMQSSSVVVDQQNTAAMLTATDVVSNFATQAQRAIQFANYLHKAQALGLNSAMVQQIASAGVDGGFATAQALASASAAQVQQLNKMQSTMQSASDGVGAAVADSMYGAGIKTAQGLVKGLKSQEKAIDAEMLRIAKSMQSAIKKALGIHSPSRVFAMIGPQVPKGLAVGIRAGIPHAVSAVMSMSSAVTAAGRRGGLATDSGVPTLTRRAGQGVTAQDLAALVQPAAGGEFTGNLYLDSGEFLGAVKGTVKPMIKASEQAQARRAKVGRR